MNIGILTIATGKYKKFIPSLYQSIEKFFLKNNKKTFVLFTDDVEEAKSILNTVEGKILYFKIQRKGFPGDTLYRYHHFSSARQALLDLGADCPDVLYYFDADMLVVDDVNEEVLPTPTNDLIGTAHPGYFNRPGHNPLGTPENNPKSKAYIPPNRPRPCYWAGGFNGGKFEAFLDMSDEIKSRVDEDDDNGIMAIWHDESHLNAYYSEKFSLEKVKTLIPAFCYPESWNLPYPKKILALDKNHAEVRS